MRASCSVSQSTTIYLILLIEYSLPWTRDSFRIRKTIFNFIRTLNVDRRISNRIDGMHKKFIIFSSSPSIRYEKKRSPSRHIVPSVLIEDDRKKICDGLCHDWPCVLMSRMPLSLNSNTIDKKKLILCSHFDLSRDCGWISANRSTNFYSDDDI